MQFDLLSDPETQQMTRYFMFFLSKISEQNQTVPRTQTVLLFTVEAVNPININIAAHSIHHIQNHGEQFCQKNHIN